MVLLAPFAQVAPYSAISDPSPWNGWVEMLANGLHGSGAQQSFREYSLWKFVGKAVLNVSLTSWRPYPKPGENWPVTVFIVQSKSLSLISLSASTSAWRSTCADRVMPLRFFITILTVAFPADVPEAGVPVMVFVICQIPSLVIRVETAV